jgi:hypothetical protein
LESAAGSSATPEVISYCLRFRSITGADHSQPVFDGRSKNPNDHLINLDDDSMERIPDVRVYFWAVGDALRGTDSEGEVTSKHTLEEAITYDNLVVREGREHVRSCRDQGLG